MLFLFFLQQRILFNSWVKSSSGHGFCFWFSNFHSVWHCRFVLLDWISRHYHSITIKMLWFTFTLHVINIPDWLGIYCVYILYTLLYISSDAIWRRSGKRSNKRYGVSINIYYIKLYICWNTYVTCVYMLHILKVGSSSTAN